MSDTSDAFIMGIIALNVTCVALTFVDMPQWLVTMLFYLNIIFTTIFAIETVAKMTALGIKAYFMDRWCSFDFFVAFLSLVQIGIEVWTSSDIPAVNLLRVFRVARIFRLVPKVRADTLCWCMLLGYACWTSQVSSSSTRESV
jgi:hypothetical protein